MKISERIKKYRKDNNLTQTDLANKLYVTKQAISKWETEQGLPDVSLYPALSDLLNVSIDELMGKEKDKKINNYKLIFLSTLGISIIIVLTLLFIFLPKDIDKRKHINDTEKYLDIKLPKIETYEFKEFNQWISFNNYQYPQDMYYFIFKDEIIKIDDTWVESFNEDIVNTFPYATKSYIDTCDAFKLVNKDTKAINEIPNPKDSKYDRYVLYCLQIEEKRLIVINFEV